MPITINSNTASLVSQRHLTNSTNLLTKTYERLSTGLRINRAGDDAAGLSISEALQGQISGYSMAERNCQDGLNAINIAADSLGGISDHIQRIRELCVQAANGVYSSSERSMILTEIFERLEDINQQAKITKFNDTPLLTGETKHLILQIGANSELSTNTIDLGRALPTVNATVLGIALDKNTVSGGNWTPDIIRNYLDTLDEALTKLTTAGAQIGAMQNRLEANLQNLDVMTQNITEANSRIIDTDIAEETANMTTQQVRQQAAASVLAQVNQLPAIALTLLQ